MRGIPLKTGVTIARERARERRRQSLYEKVHFSVEGIYPSLKDAKPSKRGRMRPQISSKAFEEKLLQLQDLLSDLMMFATEGFDTSQLEKETKDQITRLLEFLGRNQTNKEGLS